MVPMNRATKTESPVIVRFAVAVKLTVTGVPLVATNDCHYVKKDDAVAHDALLCIGTGSTLVDPNRLRFDQHEFYYNSPEEMYSLFKHCPEAVRESLKIAERCQINIKLDQMLLPHYEVPAGQEAEVPVLVCTGFGENEEVQALLSAGARGLLAKPYRLAELAEALAGLTRGADVPS